MKLHPVMELNPLGLIPIFPTTEEVDEFVIDCSERITKSPAEPRLGAVGLLNTRTQSDVEVAVSVAVEVNVAVSVAVAVAVRVAVVVAVIVAVAVFVAVNAPVTVLVAVTVIVRVSVDVPVLIAVSTAVGVKVAAGAVAFTGFLFHFPHPATALNNSNVKSNTPLNLIEEIFIWFHPSVFL